MRLQSTLVLAVAISNAAAFTPFAMSPLHAHASRVCFDTESAGKTVLRATARPQVLPGIDLPSVDDTPEEIRHLFVDQRVQQFLGPALGGVGPAMLGKPKTDKSSTLLGQKLIVASQKIASQIDDPSKYKFFGNGEHAKNLEYLLKTNPFMAAALTEKGRGFELRSFDKDDHEATAKDATLFRQIMSCLGGGAGHRVNVRFNSDMTIDQIRVYEENKGDEIARIKSSEKESIDKWASSALFNLTFYASCVHANIHVLHYLLTAGLNFSSRDFDAMNEWAKFYATNVPDKYGQVGQLLLRSQPSVSSVLLGGRSEKVDDGSTVLDTYALLTGSSGFGADGDKLRRILTNLLNTWGENPSEYLAMMMNVPKDKFEKAGILTEFMKHHDLIPSYARDVTKALQSIDRQDFAIAEDRLKVYFKRCAGFSSKIDSLEDWIELMAVTGIVHGTTLSYSRLLADVDVLRWRDIQSSTWKVTDVNLHLKILGTISGMDEHRHVMSSSTDIVGEKYDSRLQYVLKYYEEKADDLKEAYMKNIMEDWDEFNNYGWILSDFCPSGFDGKQLTVTTYI